MIEITIKVDGFNATYSLTPKKAKVLELVTLMKTVEKHRNYVEAWSKKILEETFPNNPEKELENIKAIAKAVNITSDPIKFEKGESE